jgi:hypothetical protein
MGELRILDQGKWSCHRLDLENTRNKFAFIYRSIDVLIERHCEMNLLKRRFGFKEPLDRYRVVLSSL